MGESVFSPQRKAGCTVGVLPVLERRVLQRAGAVPFPVTHFTGEEKEAQGGVRHSGSHSRKPRSWTSNHGLTQGPVFLLGSPTVASGTSREASVRLASDLRQPSWEGAFYSSFSYILFIYLLEREN